MGDGERDEVEYKEKRDSSLQRNTRENILLVRDQAENASRSEIPCVTIADEGISDPTLADRIKKSKNVLGVLRRLGAFTKCVPPARSICLYKSLVQSRWEYCLHVTPWTSRVAAEVKKSRINILWANIRKDGETQLA